MFHEACKNLSEQPGLVISSVRNAVVITKSSTSRGTPSCFPEEKQIGGHKKSMQGVPETVHWVDNNHVVRVASAILEPSSISYIAIRDSRPNFYHEFLLRDWHRGNVSVTLETQILQQPPVGARCTAT